MQTYLDSRNKKSGDAEQSTVSLTKSTGSKFGNIASSASVNSLTSSGFKFGGTTAGSSSSGSGFKIGDSSANSNSSSQGSGFQMASIQSSEMGFKFGSTPTTKSDSSQSLGTGFKFGNPSATNSDSSMSLGTGFKFGNPSTTGSDSSMSLGTGFKFGNPSTTGSDSSQSLGTGFKFGVPTTASNDSPVKSVAQSSGTGLNVSNATSDSQLKSGFNLGNGSVNSNSQSLGGGFGNTSMFGAKEKPAEVGSKLTNNNGFSTSDAQSKGIDFQFGKTVSSASSSAAGFGLGNPTLTAATTLTSSKETGLGTKFSVQNGIPSFGSANAMSSPVGGFTFGQKSESGKDPLKATMSVPGGFNFQSPLTGATSTASSVSQTGFANSSIGGFTFSANKTNTSTVNSIQTTVYTASSSVGGFAFMASGNMI